MHPPCIPLLAVAVIVAAVSVAVSVAGTVVSAQQQKKANAAAKQQAENNYAIEATAQSQRAIEQTTATTNQTLADQIRARQALGQARAAFAGSNVGGGAMDAVLRDLERQRGRSAATGLQQTRFLGTSRFLEQRASFSRTVQDTEAHLPDASINPLDIAGGVIGGASSGLSVYSGGGGFAKKH
jgi:hypothetical protein